MTIVHEKTKLREIILKKLRSQSAKSRQEKSNSVIKKLRNSLEFQNSKTVMFYVAMPEEVDTIPLLEEALHKKRNVAVPWLDQKTKSLIPVQIGDSKNDLVPGAYSILEPRAELVHPFEVSRLDLVLVPGIAFDRQGHRLGRGKGYYDRFLKTLPPHVTCFGLAFDFQIFKSVPTEDFDVSVGRVITNR